MTWKMLQFMHRLQFAIAGVKPGGQQVRRVRWPLTRRRQNQASSINETSKIGRTRDKAPTTSSSFEEYPAAWWRRGRSSIQLLTSRTPLHSSVVFQLCKTLRPGRRHTRAFADLHRRPLITH